MKSITHMLDGGIVDRNLFFSSSECNGLYSWKLDSNIVEFVQFFPGEDIFAKNLFGHVIVLGGRIYFLPINASYVCEYNVENGMIETICFPGKDNDSVHISCYIRYKDGYLLIPANLRDMFFYFDLKEKRITAEETIGRLVSEKLRDKDAIICRHQGACLCGDKLFVAVMNTDVFVEINLKERVVDIHVFEGMLFNNVISYDDKLWFTDTRGNIVGNWNLNGEKKIYLTEDGAFYFSFIPYRDKLLLVSTGHTRILKFDDDDWHFYWENQSDNHYTRVDVRRPGYAGWCDLDDRLILLPYTEHQPLLIVYDGGKTSEIILELEEIYINQYRERKNRILSEFYQSGFTCATESEQVDLNDYIAYVGR